MADKYGFLARENMMRISNAVAGGKEDYRSLDMQKWGYDRDSYNISYRKY